MPSDAHPTLGAAVQATLWQVEFRHLSAKGERPEQPDEPRGIVQTENPFYAMMQAQLQVAARMAAREASAEHWVNGRAFVLTADPSGADLHRVACAAVLGSGEPTHDFSIISVQRVADSVKGLAVVESLKA